MNRKSLVVSTAAFTILTALSALALDAKYEPIANAMKFAHKAPKGEKKVCEKIVDGSVSEDDLKKTLDLYKGMAETEPPKGSAADFKTKVAKLIAATQEVVDKKPDATVHYKEAVNCKACHSEHKAD